MLVPAHEVGVFIYHERLRLHGPDAFTLTCTRRTPQTCAKPHRARLWDTKHGRKTAGGIKHCMFYRSNDPAVGFVVVLM